MNKSINETNEYLQSVGWDGLGLDAYHSEYEHKRWNEYKTDEEAYNKFFLKCRESLFGIEKSEFHNRTCAMSDRGAAAYAANWN